MSDRPVRDWPDPVFTQVWPPPEAMTLLALVQDGDTRLGWMRWTWEPGKPVFLQRDDAMLAGRDLPDFSDPVATRDWAQQQGWAKVYADGPWPPS